MPAYRFGSFELDARSGELRKLGIRIRLQDQPRQVLLLLLTHAGEVVTREQIRQHLWPDNTFVDFDNAINSAVRKLRDALGDAAENPRFIETLARRGYRFVAPLHAETGGPSEAPQPAPTIPVRGGKSRLAAAFAALAIVAIAAMLARAFLKKDMADVRVVPLTANLGLELHPSFSPDGTRIAYVWSGTEGRNFGIYVKLVGAGDPIRISRGIARDFSPAWSPDGRWIAALRDFGREDAVMLIPSSGGAYRESARVQKASPAADACVSTDAPHLCGLLYSGSLLAWSQDGKYLFTSGLSKANGAMAILRISAESGEQQAITSPPAITAGDFGPAVSPDGRELAFVREKAWKAGDLYVAALRGDPAVLGPPRQVTLDDADIESLAWAADGRELIFSSNRKVRRELWRIDASGRGQPVRLSGLGEDATDLAISPMGRRLVYSRGAYHGSLWKVPIEHGTGGAAVRVTATTARDKFSHFSPDGKRIAFQSGRSGVDEIWVCDEDGANAVQLTNFGRGMSGSPRWSPDGKTIAFDSNVTGNGSIWVIPAEGGRPKRVTTNPAINYIPSWSRDGRWIYFTSSATGAPAIWKIHPDGSSETRVTVGGVFTAAESSDGNYLYYELGTGDGGELWKMPIAGGAATKVLDFVSGRLFTVTRGGIYFAAGAPALQLRYLDFLTASVRTIAPLDGFAHADVSPDERWALYPRVVLSDTNLMLAENVR